jgi:hypothetical protein
MTRGEIDDGATERGVGTKAAVAAVEKHVASGGRVPDEKAVDVRIRLESLCVLQGHEIEAASAQLRVIDGSQRVENRTVERAVQFRRDVRRRLLANLSKNDVGLRLQRRNGAMLQKQHQRRRTQRRRERNNHGRRSHKPEEPHERLERTLRTALVTVKAEMYYFPQRGPHD